MSDIILDSNVSKAKDQIAREDVAVKKAIPLFSPIVNPAGNRRVKVPTIYIWEDEIGGLLTAAFMWAGRNYGLSFPLDQKRKHIDKQHLKVQVRDTLDVLVHHGKDVLGQDGNVNPDKVKDLEANRFWQDPLWRNRVLAFRQAVLFKDISKDEAIKLNLL